MLLSSSENLWPFLTLRALTIRIHKKGFETKRDASYNMYYNFIGYLAYVHIINILYFKHYMLKLNNQVFDQAGSLFRSS